jgi:predicted aminopeptidase
MGTTACRAGYVARVSAEHLRFVYRAVPISDEIARASDPERRAKLELVLAARDFAARSGLEPGGSYLEVSETTGLATAHVVTAAHQDRLEPFVWKYPVVGTMPYRGYFERSEADAYAAELATQGLDTYVVEASGYSTLGWMNDPLPSGVLRLEPARIVGFVLHELTHRRLFVPGEVDFNETLASAVEARLTEAFFAERGDAAGIATASRLREEWREEAAACDALAARLEAYFAKVSAATPVEREEMLAGRRAIYAEAAPRFHALGLVASRSPPGEATAEINNAVLLAWYRYRRRVGDVEAFLDRYASVADALSALEVSLEETADPWLAILPPAGKMVPDPIFSGVKK